MWHPQWEHFAQHNRSLFARIVYLLQKQNFAAATTEWLRWPHLATAMQDSSVAGVLRQIITECDFAQFLNVLASAAAALPLQNWSQ